MENLDIHVFPTRELMGRKAGEDVEKRIIDLLEKKHTVRMIFAAAPSQNELLDYLKSSDKIAWDRIIAFHMDEYVGLNGSDSHSFSAYLNDHIFKPVNFKQVYLINGKAPEDDEIERYSKLINEAPIDIVCLGIGENGHIAFNDPHVADFEDKKTLKKIKLDLRCRIQQVNEDCFDSLDDVPEKAFTLSIPVLFKADYLFCVAPGANKRKAVFDALNGGVSTKCPASILQKHPNCKFYFDKDSYGYLPKSSAK